MKLHSIELINVRGIGHLVIDELPDTGVIVIAGENEKGKSTIAEAIHVALTFASRSAARDVLSLRPNNRDAAPDIRLDMTLGNHRFTLRKVMPGKKSGSATEINVISPSPRQLTGEDAQQWLDELVRGEGTRDLWNAFVARQGTEQKALQLGVFNEVSSALQELSGGTAETRDHQSVLEAAQKERAKYYTKDNKEKSSLKDATAAVEAAEIRLGKARAKVEAVRGQLAEAELNDRRQEELVAALPAAGAEVAEWEAKVAELGEFRRVKATADSAAKEAAMKLELATQATHRREDLIAEYDDARVELAGIREKMDPLQEEAKEEERELKRVEKLVAATRAARDRSVQLRQLAESDLGHHGEVHQLAELARVLERVRELDATVEEKERKLAGHRITAEDAKRARQAEHEWITAQKVMEASSPELTIAADDADVEVIVDGTAVTVGDTALLRPVTTETTVRVGGVTMTVSPGDGSGGYVGDEAAAREALDDILRELGVSSVQRAEQKAQARDDAQMELNKARMRLEAELQNRDLAELEERGRGLKATVNAYPDVRADAIAEWAAIDGEVDAPPLPETEEESRKAFDDARAAHDAAGVAYEEALHEQQEINKRPTRGALREAQAAERARERDVSRAEQLLRQAREQEDDEALAERLEACAAGHREALAAVAAAQRALDERGAEDADESLRGAQTNLRNKERQLQELRLRRGELTGELRAVSGVNEEFAEAGAELTRLRRERDSLHRRAAAAKLLYDVLEASRRETRKAIGEPLLAKLSQYGGAVFGPGTTFELTDDLAIKSRSNVSGTFEFDALSGGAQEQIDVLLRLAVAGVMDGQGGAPVIIDDALGYSDPRRLRKMNNAFARAGEDSQVLVLTCYPDRFSRIPDSLRLDMDDLLRAGS